MINGELKLNERQFAAIIDHILFLLTDLRDQAKAENTSISNVVLRHSNLEAINDLKNAVDSFRYLGMITEEEEGILNEIIFCGTRSDEKWSGDAI